MLLSLLDNVVRHAWLE